MTGINAGEHYEDIHGVLAAIPDVPPEPRKVGRTKKLRHTAKDDELGLE